MRATVGELAHGRQPSLPSGLANDGRRDTSDRVDEALAEGFAQH
jgi:hypothetical protein